MKIQWIELSFQKRKALHIILKEHETDLKGICSSMEMSKGSIFNKLNGKCKFKEQEYMELLKIIGITDEEPEKYSKDNIIKFLLKKEL